MILASSIVRGQALDAGFFVCKLKKVANGPKEQAGGEEDELSDMEGADEGIAAEEEEVAEKAGAAKAGKPGGRKRKAADVDAEEEAGMCTHLLWPTVP